MRRLILLAPMFLALCIYCNQARADVSGLEGRSRVYGNRGALSDYSVTVKLDRVAFLLNEVAGNYRLVRIVIKNKTNRTLALSSTNDALEYVYVSDGADKVVRAHLAIDKEAERFWKDQPKDIQRKLRYPSEIESNDERIIYVFFPRATQNDLPTSFTWTIKSLQQPIEIRPFEAAAR